ncbi:hypothetical protein C426_0455 [Lactococcus garvieae DCC43]|uniref:Uncharacterized protein n=1 Tax=Lactococcus garvieae DCC43 TaxID=1231377 RepID=K2QFF3_9LACT|nr:hypothetical protein C426_0455 [Lactococcus garvieae DCC43]
MRTNNLAYLGCFIRSNNLFYNTFYFSRILVHKNPCRTDFDQGFPRFIFKNKVTITEKFIIGRCFCFNRNNVVKFWKTVKLNFVFDNGPKQIKIIRNPCITSIQCIGLLSRYLKCYGEDIRYSHLSSSIALIKRDFMCLTIFYSHSLILAKSGIKSWSKNELRR